MKFWDDFDNFFQASEHLFPRDFFQSRGSLFQFESETIEEGDDKFVLSVDLPGVEESTIEITVDSHKLRIASERDGRKSSRAFQLGDGIDEDNISAVYKNGVLTVSLPKRETAAPRRIELSS